MTMENVTYLNHIVTISYTVECGRLNFDALSDNEEFHESQLMGYANSSDEYFIMLIDAIIEAKANLHLNFTDCKGKRLSLTFTTEELINHRPGNDTDPKKELQAFAEAEKTQIPRKIREGLVSVGVDLNSKYYTHIYSVDESIYSIQSFKDNALALKESLIKQLNPNEQILSPLKLTNRGLAYKYIGATSGKSHIVYIESEELPSESQKENVITADENAEKQLREMIKIERQFITQKISEGITIIEIILDDKNLIYVSRCDESLYDIDNFQENKTSMKQSILDGFDYTNPYLIKQLQLLKATQRGIVYKYIGDISGKTCVINISSNEIKKL